MCVPDGVGGGRSQTEGSLCGVQTHLGLYFEDTEEPVGVLNMKVMCCFVFEDFAFILK